MSCIFSVLSLLKVLNNQVALIAVNVYVIFFELGLGPVIAVEMFNAKYVATAMSTRSQLNWACNFVVVLLFPYMSKYLGAYSFVPFAAILAVVSVYTLRL